MRLLLSPVLILYVVVGMLACSDAGNELSGVSTSMAAVRGPSPLEMKR